MPRLALSSAYFMSSINDPNPFDHNILPMKYTDGSALGPKTSSSIFSLHRKLTFSPTSKKLFLTPCTFSISSFSGANSLKVPDSLIILWQCALHIQDVSNLIEGARMNAAG
mmetsp:Transcript_28913/g.35259  ORF Transcript_28913/g.35259 Transcript_28913/m.35259 type:complete len:111 (+) Transcript_28913:1036-1368(+)